MCSPRHLCQPLFSTKHFLLTMYVTNVTPAACTPPLPPARLHSLPTAILFVIIRSLTLTLLMFSSMVNHDSSITSPSRSCPPTGIQSPLCHRNAPLSRLCLPMSNRFPAIRQTLIRSNSRSHLGKSNRQIVVVVVVSCQLLVFRFIAIKFSRFTKMLLLLSSFLRSLRCAQWFSRYFYSPFKFSQLS